MYYSTLQLCCHWLQGQNESGLTLTIAGPQCFYHLVHLYHQCCKTQKSRKFCASNDQVYAIYFSQLVLCFSSKIVFFILKRFQVCARCVQHCRISFSTNLVQRFHIFSIGHKCFVWGCIKYSTALFEIMVCQLSKQAFGRLSNGTHWKESLKGLEVYFLLLWIQAGSWENSLLCLQGIGGWVTLAWPQPCGRAAPKSLVKYCESMGWW